MKNLKGFGRKRSWPNLKLLSQTLPGGTEENHENLSQDCWPPCRDLNPGPPEYEVGVLITRPRRILLKRIIHNECVHFISLVFYTIPQTQNVSDRQMLESLGCLIWK
jgi:hypothetical protein